MTTLRVARPTNDLDACVRFYRDAIGLTVLSSFTEHGGFDGVMLGIPGAQWHLEVVRERGVVAPRAPTPEHLLVLYVPERDAWERAVARAPARRSCRACPLSVRRRCNEKSRKPVPQS